VVFEVKLGNMKKIKILTLLLMIGVLSYGSGNPICPYNENGYSIAEVKTFALGDGLLNENYRKEMLRLVNQALVSSGEQLVLTENNISWLLDQVIYKPITLSAGYKNSRTLDGFNLSFFNDDKGFTGEVGIFVFGKCYLILFKTICMNLLDVSWNDLGIKIPNQLPISTNAPVVNKDTIINITNIINIPRDTIINVINLNLPKQESTNSPVKVKDGKLLFWKIAIPVISLVGIGTYAYFKYVELKKPVTNQKETIVIPIIIPSGDRRQGQDPGGSDSNGSGVDPLGSGS